MVKKKVKTKKKNANYNWIIKVTLLAFVISMLFSTLSSLLIPNVNIFAGVIIVILFIAIGVIFDMIGIAVTSSNEKPFHSMSAKKMRGAKVAVNFIKNAEKVSSFCNDVIGDICGIISGSAGIVIASSLASKYDLNLFILTLLVTAFIASLTIGGKALGKSFAINKNNDILYEFAKITSYFYRV